MEQATAQWEDFRTYFRVVPPRIGSIPKWEDFEAALDDDFNTPKALAILHTWRRHRHDEWLWRGLEIFGLRQPKVVETGIAVEHDQAMPIEVGGRPPEAVQALADQRHAARAARDFGEADRLRSEIESAGWEVQDVAGGFRLIPKA